MTEVAKRLLPWFRIARRRLPWRESPDPYRVWISELMLQQTRVETVVPYFERFLRRFPDLGSLAAASEQDVLASWSGLGYYRRARALHRTARILAGEKKGRFPEDVDGWMALPGIGRYTAGAIVSIAFGKRAPILDGNVSRVLARLYGVRGDPRSGPVSRKLWRLAEEILPRGDVSEFNQALMELGALVCTPRSPRCPACPLRRECAARRTGMQHRLPELKAPPPSVPVVMAAAVVLERKRLLLFRRTRTRLLKDLWEPPLGECASGEEPRAAIAREARASYGIELEPNEELLTVKHSIMNRRITLHAYSAELESRPSRGLESEYRWVSRDRLGELPLSSMVRKLIERIG